MSFWGSLFGSAAAEPVEAIGNTLDKLFTSDDEREQNRIVLERLRQHPAELQVELNKIEAGHRSVFVAGWRPAIGWVCAVGLSFVFVINPVIQWQTGQPGPELPVEFLGELVLALLGLGALRTFEKFGGRTK